MTTTTTPKGAAEVTGMVHRPSPRSVSATVEALTGAIEGAGAKVFAVVDHSGEAEAVGLALRDTKLLLFGNPRAGTPLMQVAPTSAIDLPLKILVWADDAGEVWMSYLAPSWLAARHGIAAEAAAPLAAVEALTARLAGPD